MSFGYLIKDVWWIVQGWRQSKRRKPCVQVYKTLDMQVINLALATINHSKERQEQRAIIKLRETLSWQVEEISQRKHRSWAERKREI